MLLMIFKVGYLSTSIKKWIYKIMWLAFNSVSYSLSEFVSLHFFHIYFTCLYCLTSGKHFSVFVFNLSIFLSSNLSNLPFFVFQFDCWSVFHSHSYWYLWIYILLYNIDLNNFPCVWLSCTFYDSVIVSIGHSHESQDLHFPLLLNYHFYTWLWEAPFLRLISQRF